ncbi:alanyl-tRNA editing protein [Jeotgalibacillus salarius]|uniref:Alanine--tRNA ligase n=2 Tax=Jeotgalibacillus salarius TaxID=546023 RepID=A0A4Y8LFR7_9BACL|nr:alanyl-tRNA editing protein [Jeotgalibacillus salarius]
MRTFQAKKTGSGTDEEGRNYVVLDQTAFYPTGGGQPHDTGHLNGVPVFDVEEVDGEIRHYIEGTDELPETVDGEINWQRRFDHMQQHAGQHILSAVFENDFGFKTVSFHLGGEVCSIDLEASVSEEVLTATEEKANQIILQNRPIETKWVNKDELKQYSLRKDVAVSDHIRLVIIPEFDYNGCGGTHPRSTSQVGSIKILHTEKQRGNTRVHFVCGSRVLHQLNEKHKAIQNLTATLSAPQDQLADAAERMILQNRLLEKDIVELKAKVLAFEAEQYIGEKVVKKIFRDQPIDELQQLSKMIISKSDQSVVIFVNETQEKLQLVCGRGTENQVNMNELIKSVLPEINGRGGGKPDFAQGGGEKLISAEALLETCADRIKG